MSSSHVDICRNKYVSQSEMFKDAFVNTALKVFSSFKATVIIGPSLL